MPNIARRTPVVFRKRKRRSLQVRLRIPVGLDVRLVPPAKRIESEFGFYDLQWRVEGRDLVVYHRYEQTQRIIATEKYKSLRKWFLAIEVAAQNGVLMKKGGAS